MTSPALDFCQHTIAMHGGVFTTLLLGGFAGSFTHCAGMCGPFVMAQTTSRLAKIPASGMSEWSRLKGAALLPYHLGRITTYAGLGVFVSALTQTAVMASGFQALNAALLLAAGALFLATALGDARFVKWKMPARLSRPLLSFFSAKAGTFLLRPTGISGYIAGLLLGFLPCGLLYSALMIAGSATPGAAALGMVLFGLGTIPALFTVSWGASCAGRRFRDVTLKAGRVFMLANGILLITLAARKLI
jgi:sulfite exporter TauE/SafE